MKFIPENIEFHRHKDEIAEKHSFLGCSAYLSVPKVIFLQAPEFSG